MQDENPVVVNEELDSRYSSPVPVEAAEGMVVEVGPTQLASEVFDSGEIDNDGAGPGTALAGGTASPNKNLDFNLRPGGSA